MLIFTWNFNLFFQKKKVEKGRVGESFNGTADRARDRAGIKFIFGGKIKYGEKQLQIFEFDF